MSFFTESLSINNIQKTYDEGYQIGRGFAPFLIEKAVKIIVLATFIKMPAAIIIMAKKGIEITALVFPLLANNSAFIGLTYCYLGVVATLGSLLIYKKNSKELANSEFAKKFFGTLMGIINFL